MVARSVRTFGQVLCVMVALTSVAAAQISVLSSAGAGPQARSHAELSAVGAIYDAPDSHQIAMAAARFVKEYPSSEFAEYANTALMHANLEQRDRTGAKRAAESVLNQNPKNTDALLCLAEIAAERGSADREFRQTATQYASSALEELRKLTLPITARRGAWLRSKKELLARAYAILGWLAFEDGRSGEALNKIREAAALDAQGLYFYRLALVYEARNEIAPAIESLQTAEKLGTGAIHQLAVDRRRNLQSLPAAKPGQ